jgi:hypothetical protein
MKFSLLLNSSPPSGSVVWLAAPGNTSKSSRKYRLAIQPHLEKYAAYCLGYLFLYVAW